MAYGGVFRRRFILPTAAQPTLPFSKASALVNKTLTADAGSYTITGNAAAPKVGFKAAAVAGSYALTGSDAVPFKLVNRSLGAETGAYNITGADYDVGRGLITSAGSYLLTGSDVATTFAAMPGHTVAFRSLASVVYAPRVGVTSVGKPTGTEVNDILLATMIWRDPGTTITPPSGFTAIRAPTSVTAGITVSLQMFWKRATAIEPANYSFAHDGGLTMRTELVLEAYSQCIDIGNPVDASSVASGTGSTTSAASITPTTPLSVLVLAGHNFDADGSSPPAGTGWAERYDYVTTVYDSDYPGTSPTGVITHTPNGSLPGDPWQSWLVALKRNPDVDVAPTGNVATAGVGQVDVIATTNYAHVAVTGNLLTASVGETLFTMGVPVFRSLSDTGFGTTADEAIAAIPSGVQADDILLATMVSTRANDDPVFIVGPAGFTAIGPETMVVEGIYHVRMRIWWKRATASEPATYTFTHTGYNLTTQVVIEAFSNCVRSTSPIDTYSVASGVGSTSTATSITTSFTDDLLILSGHNFDALGSAAPSGGWIERLDTVATIYELDWTDPGPTGAITHTPNGSDTLNPWQSWLVALRSRLSSSPRFTVTGQQLTVGMEPALGLTGALYGWDDGTLTGAGVLSIDDKVLVAGPSASPTTVKSTMTHGGGLHYVEVQFFGDSISGRYGLYNEENDTGILIDLATGDVEERPSGIVTSGLLGPILNTDTVGLAYSQLSPAKMWIRKNAEPWNGDPAQAPDSTGIGLWEPPVGVGCRIPDDELVTWTGLFRITEPDQTFEGYYFPFTVIMADEASGCTFRDCKFFSNEYYGIAADTTFGTTIDHCTVTGNPANPNGLAGIAIGYGGSIVSNCDISIWQNGIFFSTGCFISNNYFHDASFLGDDPHVDGFQSAGGHDVVIDNNWVESFDTSGIMIQAVYEPVYNIRIEDNTIGTPEGRAYSVPIYVQSFEDPPNCYDLFINRNRLKAGFTGYYIDNNPGSTASIRTQPECFDNVDYYTGAPVLEEFQGFAVSGTGLGMAASAGFTHVAPVEPTGTSMTVLTSYVGIAAPPPAAAPVRRSHVLSAVERTGPAIVTKPSGTAEGDLMIMVMMRVVTIWDLPEPPVRDPVPPAGWTKFDVTRDVPFAGTNTGQFTIWYKRAGASEPDTYSWGFWEYATTQTFIASYENIRPGAGGFDSYSYNEGSTAEITALSVFATQPLDLLLYFGWNNTFDDLAPPPPPLDMTEIVDEVLYVAETSLALPGYTGDRTHTQSGTAMWAAYLIALRGA